MSTKDGIEPLARVAGILRNLVEQYNEWVVALTTWQFAARPIGGLSKISVRPNPGGARRPMNADFVD